MKFRILHKRYVLPVMLICAWAGIFRLRDLPLPRFVDIDVIDLYVRDVLSGRWPWYYVASNGPFYHYLIAPAVWAFGNDYLTYKFISVAAGLVGIYAAYLLYGALLGSVWAEIGALLLGTSFWYLAWERLGDFIIVIIPVVSLMSWCLLKWERTGRDRWFVAGFALSVLGLFIYPETWILPLLYATLVFFAGRTPSRRSVAAGFLTLGIAVVMAVPLVTNSWPDLGPGGYVGTKLWANAYLRGADFAVRLGSHSMRTLGMLHIGGDSVARVNVPGDPQLDMVSGILWLVGIAWFVRRGRTGRAHHAFVPMIFLSALSVMPVLPDIEVPSSSRTIGALPYHFLAVTAGLKAVHDALARRSPKAAALAVALIIATVLALNGYKYFFRYPAGLPQV